MKCQILFSGKNKKNIDNLSSAKFDHSMVSVKHAYVIGKFSQIAAYAYPHKQNVRLAEWLVLLTAYAYPHKQNVRLAEWLVLLTAYAYPHKQNVRLAEWLVLLTFDHKVLNSIQLA